MAAFTSASLTPPAQKHTDGLIPRRTIRIAPCHRRIVIMSALSSPGVRKAEISVPDGEYTPSDNLSSMNLATSALNALFSFQPFFRFAAGKARDMMVSRGDAIGYPWAPTLKILREHDWESEVKAVERKDVQYPEYFLKPFHAYEKGNMSWDAALEVELAARAVHAPIFDPKKSILDPEGDANLRRSYHTKIKELINVPGGYSPATIVDIGCCSGLSTFSLLETFPNAKLIGIDLSPFFVAVANYYLRKKSAEQGKELAVEFIHAAGEATTLPSESVDHVSICLVCHELPRHAAKEIIKEAHRILRPAGVLSIMDMDPRSPFLQKMANDVFMFTAFKATEPYLDDYRTFPIEEAIAKLGFEHPKYTENTPRHRTIVARKL